MIEREQWHPIMAAEEESPGRWVMLDTFRKPYGIIRLVRRGDQIGYRADTWSETPGDETLIGYYTNLKAAAKATHMKFLVRHTGPDYYHRAPSTA